jgi:hypothetical protein
MDTAVIMVGIRTMVEVEVSSGTGAMIRTVHSTLALVGAVMVWADAVASLVGVAVEDGEML